MISQIEFSLPEYCRGFHIITNEILKKLPQLPQKAILNLFIKHTSAALAINENYDRDVRTNLNSVFDNLVKENQSYYKHISEGDDDMPAHAKAVIAGTSINIPVTEGKLNLGTWQGIYLCEFRNKGGHRKIVATIIG